MSNLKTKGKCSYQVHFSSGWIHENNTVDMLDLDGNIIKTYTISRK